jgi:outer membrane receptor protein involved in Fe transport
MLWTLAFGLALFALNLRAADEDEDDEEDDEEVEEMVVTGSYIRRTNFDLPSPKSVIDNIDIEMSGNAELGDVIFDQSFQLGVNANAAPFEGICCSESGQDGMANDEWGGQADNQQGNQGTEVWANLRGLGTRATMTMMDGHRLPADTTPRGERAGVDVSGMYPAIAVGRVDTILDGASALYGAEAVSGVINMVPRKDFEGLTISLDWGQPLENGAVQTGVSLLAGVQGDRGRAIFAMELRDTERMRFTDRPAYIIDTKNPWARHETVGNDHYTYGQWSRFWKDAYDAGGSPASRIHVPLRSPTGELMTPAERSALEATGTIGYAGQPTHRQYADNMGVVAMGWNQDPSCAHGFANGHDNEGPPPLSEAGPFFDWGNGADAHDAQRDRWQSEYGDHWGTDFRNVYGETYTYNDIQKHGNFMNGYMDPNDPAYHCRMVDSDYQDIQAQSERQKGMGYFEYEFNDYVTVRGEFVTSTADYNTRLYAPAFNDFDTSSGGLVNDRMGIAVGSNPGNPFRAFADGSTVNTYFTGTDGTWDPNDNNTFLPPGDDQYWPGVEPSVWPGGSNTWSARPTRQLDFRDLNGNGRYDYLEEPGELLVFAQDADGDGIPDRDWDGDGMADLNVQRDPRARVVLMGLDDADGDGIPDRFDPDGGGIPFYEDARFEERRLFAFPKQPRNNNLDWAENDGILHFLRRTKRQDIRLRLGTEIRIPETDWIVDADWIWAQGVRETNQYQEVTSELIQALRCNAGPNQNSCWNPFGTTYMMMDENGYPIGDPNSKFPGPNDPGWTPSDHDFVNTEDEHRLAGNVMAYNLQDLGMTILDVVAANSNVFDLWYNDQPVGFAVGMHWRLEEEEYRPHALAQAAIGGNRYALRKSEQESQAIFAEVSLPLISHETWGEMEAQVAVRYSEITAEGILGQPGTAKFTTTIPKLAVRYSPTDYLAVRGSMTQGFVTPGLYALFGAGGTTIGGAAGGITTVGTVRDYVCDYLPDLRDCIDAGASTGGGVPNVESRAGSSPDLDAETSDLYNIGFSLKFMDGDLVVDVDYTSVEFRGQIEQTTPADQIALNENGFTGYVENACPGTLVDWDNERKHGDPALAALTQEQFRTSSYTNAQDLACRRNAAISWLQSGANAGQGERSFAGGALERGRDGSPLLLRYVEGAWTAQGSREAETVIYGVRYGFALPDNRWTNWIGEDKGAFLFTLSATQFLTQTLTKFKSSGCDAAGRNEGGFCIADHVLAGITVDGVGNRNSQYFSPPNMHLMSDLPPTPEFRAQAGLRWFNGPHTAQLMVRWHDSVTNVNVAWDAMKEREAQDPRVVIAAWTWNTADRASYPHHVPFRGSTEVTIPGTDIVKQIPNERESQRCAFQPWPVCKIDSRHYWDLTYSYRRPDVLGFSSVLVNVGMRNIFDTYPDPITQFSAHEPYLDNIMGRSILLRLNMSM